MIVAARALKSPLNTTLLLCPTISHHGRRGPTDLPGGRASVPVDLAFGHLHLTLESVQVGHYQK